MLCGTMCYDATEFNCHSDILVPRSKPDDCSELACSSQCCDDETLGYCLRATTVEVANILYVGVSVMTLTNMNVHQTSCAD